MTISTKVQKIGPTEARAMISHNGLNTRPLNRNRVAQLANIMRAGGWRLTHQGIALDDNGNVIDGQHRLYAVIESGATITTFVTRGLDASEDFALIDVGKPRSISDALTIAGFHNTSLLGASLRLVYAYENSDARPWTAVRRATTPDVIRKAAATAGERMELVMPVAGRIRARINGSAAAYAAGLYIIDEWAEKHSRVSVYADWLAGMDTGADIPPKDGRLALANWVNGAGRLLNASLRTEVTMMGMLRVFHAHIKGETLDRLSPRIPETWTYRLPD